MGITFKGLTPFFLIFLSVFCGFRSQGAVLTSPLYNRMQFSAEQLNYGTGGSTPEQQNQYVDFAPSFSYFHQAGLDDNPHSLFGAQGMAIIPASQGVGPQWAVPEFFYQYTAEPNRLNFTLGRYKKEWSTLDQQIHLGLWQPTARWDAVRPIDQGLTGLFASVEDEKFRIVYFISPVFLPDQGPEFDIKDGRFVSANRWFRPPVDQAELKGTEASIHYRLDNPSTSSVINQGSQALMIEIGKVDEGAFFKFAVAAKPMNQFHLGLEPSLAAASGDLTVIVHPYVVKHNLYTVESGYRFSEGQVVLSQTWEKFENPNLPDKYQQSELIDSQYSGIVVSHDMSNLGVRRANLDLSYVRRTKATSSAQDTLIVGSVESSSQRLNFTNLYGAQFQKNIFRNYLNNLDFGIGYFYSVEDEGEWLHGEVNYQYDRRWIWNLSGDVFGATGVVDANASFISKFRGNDRMIGSFSYVF